jgi:predicted RND superfamily exporter protein
MNYKKISLYTLIGISAITLFLGYFTFAEIKFDFNLRNFYPLNNPETGFFYEYTEKFGWDDDYVLIGLETKSNDVFDYEFLKAVDSLGKVIRKHRLVQNVTSPTEIEVFRFVPYMNLVSSSVLIHLDDKERLKEDAVAVYARKELIGNLFASNKKSVALVVRQTAGLEYEQCDSLVRELEKIVQPFAEFKKVHFAGKCFGQTTFVNLTSSEMLLFVLLSLIVNVICLYITYRSLWGIWMPLTIVGVTVVWTLGTMMMFGFSLDFISNIIPTIILIIGISNIIHLLTHFLSEIDKGLDKTAALKNSIKKIGTATIFTSLTTIIGFLSLLFSNVAPLINLGAFASLGLVYAFILSYTLFPAMVMLFKPNFKTKEKSANDFIQGLLNPLFDFVMGNKKAILIVSAVLMIVGAWGSSKLIINQKILEDISERHPQIKASKYFENELSGSRQFEMEVKLLDSTKTLHDFDVLQKLEKIEKYLTDRFGIGAMFSPVGIFKEANRVQHSGQNSYFRLPETESEMKKAEGLIEKYIVKAYPKIYTDDLKTGRFSGKLGDIGSYEMSKRTAAFDTFMKKEGLNKDFSIHITGSAHLMEINNVYIASNVYYGLWFSCLIIGLIFGFLFRSFRMAIIGIIPNILPLLVVGGIMGFFGVNIKISTAILFILSFGIAVDDTIHYMSSFRFDRRLYPNDMIAALRHTYTSTGKAIIVTSLILSAGFSTLVFSSFGGTFTIGVFTSICLIVALLADLMLLPVLLYYFGKNFKAPKDKVEE